MDNNQSNSNIVNNKNDKIITDQNSFENKQENTNNNKIITNEDDVYIENKSKKIKESFTKKKKSIDFESIFKLLLTTLLIISTFHNLLNVEYLHKITSSTLWDFVCDFTVVFIYLEMVRPF